jgi:hypothetical protein
MSFMLETYLLMVAVQGRNRKKVCAMLRTEFKKAPFMREEYISIAD